MIIEPPGHRICQLSVCNGHPAELMTFQIVLAYVYEHLYSQLQE